LRTFEFIALKLKYTHLFFFYLLSSVFLFAQQPLPSPRKAKKIDDKIVIAGEKDAKQFGKYLKQFGQPKTLVFEENVNLAYFSSLYPNLDEVSQLILRGNNAVELDAFCKFPSVEHIIVTASDGDTFVINAINECNFINEVSIVFSRDYLPNKLWLNFKYANTINVLGILGKKELTQAAALLKDKKNLSCLRFGVDYAKDLPENLNQISQLRHIGFIDNLSFIENHTFHDLAIERYFINFWDVKNQKTEMLSLSYYSDRIGLEDYDKNYISSLYFNAQLLPYYTQLSEAENVAKVINDKNTNTSRAFSLFDTFNRDNKPALFFDQHSAIAKPSSLWPIVNEYFTIDASKDNVLITKAGIKVLIPKKAFINAENEMVAGKIDIAFRYISTITDFALSGIPSFFDSFNENFTLNYPQVFYLYASEKNIPLKIASGYAIDIMLGINSKRLFKLDNTSPVWYTYDDNDKINVVRYKLTPLNDTFAIQQIVDPADIGFRYFDPSYYYILDKNETKVKIPTQLKKSYRLKEGQWIYQPIEKGMKLQHGEIYLKPGKALVGVRKISFSDTARKDQVYFTIYNSLDNRLFPEIVAFSKYYFLYNGIEDKRSFTKNLIRSKKFNDIRIFYTLGEKGGYIELKDDEGYVQLTFTLLTSEDAEKNKKNILIFGKKYKKYEEQLLKRGQAQRVHINTYNLKANKDKADTKQKQLLSLHHLGYFSLANIDSNTVLASINLVINDFQGVPLDISKIMVVYKEPSAVNYFDNKQIKVDFNKEFAIIAVDFLGKIYFGTASQCKGLKSGEGSVVTLNCRIVSKEMMSGDILLKNLGFSKKIKIIPPQKE